MLTLLLAAALAILGFLCFTGPGGINGPSAHARHARVGADPEHLRPIVVGALEQTAHVRRRQARVVLESAPSRAVEMREPGVSPGP